MHTYTYTLYVTGPKKTTHHMAPVNCSRDNYYVDLIECFISSRMTPRTLAVIARFYRELPSANCLLVQAGLL